MQGDWRLVYHALYILWRSWRSVVCYVKIRMGLIINNLIADKSSSADSSKHICI